MKFTSLVVALFIAGAAAFDKCDHLRAYVAPKAPGAVRLMVVGDRQVSGEGEGAVPTDEAVFTVPDLLDGSHWGHHGFPSALAKILKAKRPTIQWEVLNFGGIDYSVTGSFWESCDYEKSLNAEPEMVFMMFGAADLEALRTEDDKRIFQNKYIALGKQYLSLGSHPQVFILTPPAYHKDEAIAAGQLNNKRFYSISIVPALVAAVGAGLNLPAENMIDIFSIFGGASDEHLDWLAGDKATANAAGGAKIAEVVYDSAIKLNNFRNHEKLYKIGRAVRQDPFV